MNTLMKCLLFLTVLLCLPLPAIHAAASDSKLLQLVMPAVLAGSRIGPRWRTPQLIETNDAGDANEARIAVDMAGNVIAVWQQSDGIRTNIWSNRYAVGSGWGTAQLIETGDDGDAIDPRVVMDSADNAIVVWDYSDGGFYHIWVNRYTAGSGWGIPQIILPDSTWYMNAWYPEIAGNSAGNAIAVWNQSDGNSLHICANRYVPSSGWGISQTIEDNPKTTACPQAAVDSTGNAAVIWGDWDGARSSIAVRHYSVASGWEIIPHHIEAENLGDASSPKVAFDSTGNIIAIWKQQDGTYSRILANRYVTGSGWGTAQLIDGNASNAQDPQIAVDSQGNAIAVWQALEGGDHAHIWANRYVAGNGWGTAQLISDHSGLAWPPQLAVDPAGNAIVVWFQYDSPAGRQGVSHIRANRYVAGRGWGSVQIIDSDNTGGCLFPQVAIDSKGRATVIWQQHDGTRGNIWAARYE